MMAECAHEWRDLECTQCGETTAPCQVCSRPMGSLNLMCHGCLASERRVLDHIRIAWPQAQGPSWALSVEDLDLRPRTTSGEIDPPVWIGPADRASSPDDFVALGRVLEANPDKHLLDLLRDPVNIVGVLHQQAHEWGRRAGSAPAGDVLEWLGSRLLWAANTDSSLMARHRALARRVRWKLRHLAGVLPHQNPAPCVHCGGKVVQDWTDADGQPHPDGLSDLLRCAGDCRTTWGDRARFDYLNLTTIRALPHTHPDALVTLADARTAAPRARRNTINQRIKRDRDRAAQTGEPRGIPERGTNHRGLPLYRLGDLLRDPELELV